MHLTSDNLPYQLYKNRNLRLSLFVLLHYSMQYVLQYEIVGEDIMARAGINYQHVLDAISQCQAQGIKPTADNCRAVLGTGSKTTINNYLKRWRAEQDFVGGGDTTALPNELVDIIKQLWERLCADSQQQITLAKDEWKKQRQDFQQQLAEKEDQLTAQQEKLETTEKSLTESQQQFSETDTQLKQLTLDYHQQTAKLESANQRFSDRQSEIDRLSALVKHVQDNLTHYQNKAQALREQQQLALDKLHQEHASKVKILETKYAESQQQLAQLEKENRLLTQNVDTLKTERNSLAQSESQLKHDLEHQSAENSQLKNQLKTLEVNLEKQQATAKTTEKSLVELTVTLKVKIDSLAEKDSMLKQQDNKLAGVLQNLDEAKAESAYLKGQLATLKRQSK